MDIVKMIRGMRNLKIFNKVNGLSKYNKFIIKNSSKNVIDLDIQIDEEVENSDEVYQQNIQNFN